METWPTGNMLSGVDARLFYTLSFTFTQYNKYIINITISQANACTDYGNFIIYELDISL